MPSTECTTSDLITSTCCLLALSLVVGCARRFDTNSISHRPLATTHKAPVYHALLHDIPVPVGFDLITTATTDASTAPVCSRYAFSGKQPVEAVVQFYQQSLEDQGWKIDSFVADETILVCKKPSKRCTITLKPHATQHAHSLISLHIKSQALSQKNDLSAEHLAAHDPFSALIDEQAPVTQGTV